jgi:hypothetical protein
MRQLDRERFLADANEAAAAEQRLLLCFMDCIFV